MRSSASARDSGHSTAPGRHGASSCNVFEGFEDVVGTAGADASRQGQERTSALAANATEDGATSPDNSAPQQELSRQQPPQQPPPQGLDSPVSDDSESESDAKRAQLTRRRLGQTAQKRNPKRAAIGRATAADARSNR